MGNLVKPTEEVSRYPDIEEPQYEAKTELGRKLVRLRKEIERSGVPLLDWDDLEREIAERRLRSQRSSTRPTRARPPG